MLYRITANENLFNDWKKYEKETGKILLSSLMQNDMYLTTGQLNEEFMLLHNTIQELKQKYAQPFLQEILTLQDKTVTYINNLNRVPLTEPEFREFSFQCPRQQPQYEGFAEQQAQQREAGVKPSALNCTHPDNMHKGFDNCSQRNCPLVQAGVYN